MSHKDDTPLLPLPKAEATAAEVWAVNAAMQPQLTAWLAGPEGASAREHLTVTRAFPQWAIDELGIGYIPPGPDRLRDAAVALGLSLEVMAAAGMCARNGYAIREAFRSAHRRDPVSAAEFGEFFHATCREQRKFYRDFYTLEGVPEGKRKTWLHGHFITFPVQTATPDGAKAYGAFQLRSLQPAELLKNPADRYRYPTETPGFSFTKELMGLAAQQDAMRQSGRVIIVEGYPDWIAAIVGVRGWPVAERPGVVLMGGSAPKGAQGTLGLGVLDQLPPYVREAILFTDDDKPERADIDNPGINATLGLAPRLLHAGLSVYVARTAYGWDTGRGPIPKDPGALLERGGPQAVHRAIASAFEVDALSFATGYGNQRFRAGGHSGTVYARLAALDPALPIIAATPEGDRNQAIARAANAFDLTPEVVAAGVTALHAEWDTEMRRSANRRSTPSAHGVGATTSSPSPAPAAGRPAAPRIG